MKEIGLRIWLKAMGSIFIQMGRFMRANGWVINKMERGWKYGLMGLNFKETM
jgi:hypothetical protein